MAEFSYHRSIAPMMWVFMALAVGELVIVHLLLSLWSGTAALILSGGSLVAVLWLGRTIASFRRLPVLLDAERLTWRVGGLACRAVPLAHITRLRETWDGAAVKDRSVLNLALIAYPNVIVDLHRPIRGRRGRMIYALAHRLDDPMAFAAALTRLMAPDD